MPPGELTFLWPRLLWALAVLPLALLGLAGVLARRRATRPRNGLQWIGAAAGGSLQGRFRRGLPPVLWVLALVLLLVALARPQAALTLPSRLETVVLALDMSGSMRATDIAPNRLEAARSAARTFVAEQPSHVRVGVVAIAAAAAVVQSPTNNREDIVQAIARLEPQRGTALGSGLIIALDTALPRAGIDVEQFINPRPGGPAEAAKDGVGSGGKDPAKDRPPATADGASAAIVLLSDGQNNVGPDPLKAAEVAAAHGVRIYTVGLGTTEGVVVKSEGWSMRTRLDETALKKVASLTEGEYFHATDAKDLKRIYKALGARIAFEKQRPTEVGAAFAAVGALLGIAAALLSLLWFDRVL